MSSLLVVVKSNLFPEFIRELGRAAVTSSGHWHDWGKRHDRQPIAVGVHLEREAGRGQSVRGAGGRALRREDTARQSLALGVSTWEARWRQSLTIIGTNWWRRQSRAVRLTPYGRRSHKHKAQNEANIHSEAAGLVFFGKIHFRDVAGDGTEADASQK